MIEHETETAHIAKMIMFKHFGGNGPEKEKEMQEAMQIQVFPIWEECYSETGDGTKVLVARINILHIAVIVNVQFEKSVAAGTVQVHVKEDDPTI